MSGVASSGVTAWGRWLAAVVVLVVAVTVLVLAVGQPTGGAGEPIPQLPRLGQVQDVDNNDVADPAILPVGGAGYVLFGTTDWRSNVPTATSTDLVHWVDVPDALPVLPRWAASSISMTWAPSVIAVGSRYLMYMTTEEAASGRQCIGLATSASPTGPFDDASKRPFLCQQNLGGSIDPQVEPDGAGHLVLVWKNDGNCCGLPTGIWEQNLTADGLHLVGRPRRLLSADEPWQHGNIEAPALTPAGTKGWWLFYSGGDWRTSEYATGVAYCPSLRSPCREVLDHPFLPSTATLRTPSGLDTFTDAKGQKWAAFTTTVAVRSRRHPQRVFLNRVLNIAPLITPKAAT
jgi:beta-xylosidase